MDSRLSRLVVCDWDSNRSDNSNDCGSLDKTPVAILVHFTGPRGQKIHLLGDAGREAPSTPWHRAMVIVIRATTGTTYIGWT